MSDYRTAGINDMYFDYNEGLKANKPAVLGRGRFYHATDESIIYFGKADGTEGTISLAAGGSGDMLKSVYDIGANNIVDKAEALNDGVNNVTAAQAKTAYDNNHVRLHNIDSASDHGGVAGAVLDHFISFNASGLPKDSGKLWTDFAAAVHTHTSANITDLVEFIQDTVGALAINSNTVHPNYNDSTGELAMDVQPNSSVQKVEVGKAGSLIGSRKRINLIEGSNLSITAVDNGVSDAVDVTLAASGVGTGDMVRSTYDPDMDGRVESADQITDGVNTLTAAQGKTAYDAKHDRQHAITSTTDHTGIQGALQGHVLTADSNGLPQDGGVYLANLSTTGHTHTSSNISDFAEACQDAVGTTLTSTSTVTLTYDDANNQIKADVIVKSSQQKIEIKRAGVSIGTRECINFIQGSGITLNVADDVTGKVDVTIAASGGGGGGDMLKSTYDTNNDGIVNKAEALGDSVSTILWSSLPVVITRSHERQHGLSSSADHYPIAAAVAGNIVVFDANGYPVTDSGYAPGDLGGGAHTHTSSAITDFVEAAQDAVGGGFATTATVNPHYTDATNSFSWDVFDNSSIQKSEIRVNGTLIGTRKSINIQNGLNVTVTGSDNAGSDRVDVTIQSTGGGGGGGGVTYETFIDSYGVHKDGTTDDTDHIQAAINAIGGTQCTLIMTNGTYLVNNANLVFSANTQVYFEKGAMLKIQNGKQVTMNVPIAGAYQIFTGSNLSNTVLRGGGGDIMAHWYGLADGGATATNTTALQAAMNVASGEANSIVYVPAGDYNVNQITYYAPLIGAGSTKTIFHPQATVFLAMGGSERWCLMGFQVVGSNSQTGVQGGAVTDGASRFQCEDLYFYGLQYGMDITGWIADMRNIWAVSCTVGARLRTVNGARINFNAESCTTGLMLYNCSGNIIDGGCIESCTTGLQIEDDDGFSASDTSQGIVLSGHYQEANQVGIKIGIALASYNHNIIIEGGKYTGNWSNGMINELQFDYVVGLRVVNAFVSCPVDVRSHAKDVKIDTAPEYYTAQDQYRASWIHNANKAAKTVDNFVINPYFRNSLRGFTSVGYGNCTGALTSSASEQYNGGGLKITSNGGGVNANCEIRLMDDIAVAMRGHRLAVGCWIYVPVNSTFDWSGFSVPTSRPEIGISYYDGTEHPTSYVGQSGYKQGAWNFFYHELEIGASATWIKVYLHVSKDGSGTCPAGAYIIASGLCVAEAPGDFASIMNGNFNIHPMAGTQVGKLIITYGSAAPSADADQSWLQGDRCLNTAPTAGGTAEWVVTSGGASPTWTALTLS